MILDSAVAEILDVREGGTQALGVLTGGHTGRIAAVFKRSIYIALDPGWICVGNRDLAMGPLNIRTSASKGVNWGTFGLKIDDPAHVVPGRLRVGNLLELHTSNMVFWAPPATPQWTTKTLLAGLDGLHEQAQLCPAGQGLAGFAMGDWARLQDNKIVDAAWQHVVALSFAAEVAFRGAPAGASDVDDAVVALLGLGPGLTPSGDDFLAGMLIAMNVLPASALRRQIVDQIGNCAADRTNAISVAHLRAACAGEGNAALHHIFNSILTGNTRALPTNLAAIDRIGHSSGWDALAGLCVTLRAYMAAVRHGGQA
jgi:hypothetical protein